MQTKYAREGWATHDPLEDMTYLRRPTSPIHLRRAIERRARAARARALPSPMLTLSEGDDEPDSG